jgi:protein-tyrosine phosphatase
MCEKAVADGVTHIVATPHCNHRYSFDREASQEKLEELRSKFDRCEFSLGCELNISEKNLSSARANPSLYTINSTRYVLVEIDYSRLPNQIENALSELISLGLVPILAHPERIPLFQKRIDLVEEWVSFGCMTAITGGALTGFWGKEAKKLSEALLREDLVNALVSDGHDPEIRPPLLESGRQAAAKIVGDKRAMDLVSTNPLAVVRGEVL